MEYPPHKRKKGAVYTQQDPNFYDYTKAPNFTKKTGIELNDFHSFVSKELIDNANDFVEEHCKGYSPTIRVYISNHPAIGFRIAVVNPNDEPTQEVFTSEYLRMMFNYKVAFRQQEQPIQDYKGSARRSTKTISNISLHAIWQRLGRAYNISAQWDSR